jgi:biotin carboxyl carrier protein
MDKRTQAASISSAYHTALLDRETNQKLAENGLVSDLIYKKSQVAAAELEKQDTLAQKEVETFENSIGSQVAVQQASLDAKRAMYELKKSQLDQLHVRPGIDGVLQELDVEVGQKVTMGTVLARVAQPTHLKAQLKNRRDSGEGHSYRPEGLDRYPQRNHPRPRHPHRPSRTERNRNRRRRSGRRAAYRCASGLERGRYRGNRAPDRHLVRRPAGSRRSEQHCGLVLKLWMTERRHRGCKCNSAVRR